MSIEYKLLTRQDELGQLANEIMNTSVYAIDFETARYNLEIPALRPWNGDIRLMQFHTGTNLYVVDLFKTGKPEVVLDAIRDTHAIAVGQNLKFEQSWLLYKYGIEFKKLFDTFRASQIMYNGLNFRHNLYAIYKRELDVGPSCPDMSDKGWEGELTPDHYEYASEDVYWMHKLRDVMKAKLTTLGLNTVAKIEFDVLLPEASVELNGMFLDKDRWMDIYRKNLVDRDRIKKQLTSLLPNPARQPFFPGLEPDFNLDSSAQMLESLRMLGIPIEDTSEITLAMQQDRFPVIATLLEYREYNHSVKSFGEEYLKHIDPTTGRIHPSYLGYLASGRYSCKKPNLSQIPRDNDRVQFRKCFRAEPGNKITGCDYAAIEMRVACELSRDPKLTEIFDTDLDPHTATAAFMNGKRIEEVTPKERQNSKCYNFGLLFSMGPKKLVLYAKSQHKMNMTEQVAQQKWHKFFEVYKGLKRWHSKVLGAAEGQSICVTETGRLRHMPPNAHGEWLNQPVQSLASEGLKTSLRLLYDRLKPYGKDARMIHHCHDEILLEVKDDQDLIKEVTAVQQKSMCEGMERYVKRTPIKAEAKSGDSWGDAK